MVALRVLGFLILSQFCLICKGSVTPVFIYELKSPGNLPSPSGLGTIKEKEFKNDYLEKMEKEGMIVFVQDTLSLEDFSIYGNSIKTQEVVSHSKNILSENPTILLPRVENPVSALRSLKEKTQYSEIDSKTALDKEFKSGEIVIIHLPNTRDSPDRGDALNANDMIINKILEKLDKSKDFSVLYTGLESSWDSKSEKEAHYRIARSLSAVDDTFGNTTDLVNSTEFLTYAEGAFMSVKSSKLNISADLKLQWPPSDTKINSSNSTVELTWLFENTEGFEGIELKGTFSNESASGFWQATDITISASAPSVTERVQFSFQYNNPEEIGASKGFSFSCNNLTLKFARYNQTTKESWNVVFKLQRFQAEFYPTNNYFSESFDCATFLTIPIWMGIVTILLFTSILAFGIFMLFEIKTMDRFDDPKGKTISVPLTD